MKSFFDLPVYRLERDRYYKEREKYVDDLVFQVGSPDEAYFRERHKVNPRENDTIRDLFGVQYGGCWEFNEIIGYVRLHFLGNQVRGEYFTILRKRIRKTRTRQFAYSTWKLAPEVHIAEPYSSDDVSRAVAEYIDDCRRELPRRHIDTSVFDALAPHIDWGALYRASR